MKKIITENYLKGNAKEGKFLVTPEMILTPLVRDYALSQGIKLVYQKEKEMDKKENLVDVVTEIVTQEMQKKAIPSVKKEDLNTNQKTLYQCIACADERRKATTQRAIVTGTGKNKTGIVAAMTKAIAESGGDIQDLSQTIVSDFFTTIMVVDIGKLKNVSFKEFKERLQKVGKDLGIEIMVMHEEIIDAMHRV